MKVAGNYKIVDLFHCRVFNYDMYTKVHINYLEVFFNKFLDVVL